MAESTAAVALAASGLFVGLLGVLVRYAGWTGLIAGYDPDRVDDEAGLADFVGANLLSVAALLLATAALDYAAAGAIADWLRVALVPAVVALAARTVVGARRYESSGGGGGDA